MKATQPLEFVRRDRKEIVVDHILGLPLQRPRDKKSAAFGMDFGPSCSFYTFAKPRMAQDPLETMMFAPDTEFVAKNVSFNRMKSSDVTGPLYVQKFDVREEGKLAGHAYLACEHKKQIAELKTEIAKSFSGNLELPRAFDVSEVSLPTVSKKEMKRTSTSSLRRPTGAAKPPSEKIMKRKVKPRPEH